MSSGWSRATVVENRVITPGLHQLTLDVPSEVARAFHTPGQYHRVRVTSADDAYFAMASAPGEPRFQYLVRAHGDVASAWALKPEGAEVEVSLPEGPGFPLEPSKGKALVLVGTGTGFAPLWSVLRAARGRRGDFGAIEALYGVDHESHLAWGDELTQLGAGGITVTPVIERPGETWRGLRGRVQHHLAALPVDDVAVFLCGHPAMVADVKAALHARGVPLDAMYLNVP